jgi:magnesium chelatase family protein
MVRPGEISLAHNGVLFLDELLEFSGPVPETLRQPLEQLRIESYRARLSGPLLDRIDLHVHVPAMAYRELAAREPGESSASVRARVEAAHTRQRARDPRSNATLPIAHLEGSPAVTRPASAGKAGESAVRARRSSRRQ